MIYPANLNIITDQYRSLLPDDLNIAIGEVGPAFSEELLSSGEHAEYRDLKHRRRREEFLSTRGIIKELAHEIGLQSKAFEIRKNELGKPFGVCQQKRFELSLAHSAQKVICALSTGIPVGVDIEPENRSVNERLRDRILHEQERSKLKDQPVIRLWTLKEALVKLNGEGLRTNLNELIVQPLNALEFTAVLGREKSARICSFTHENHWISVAYYEH